MKPKRILIAEDEGVVGWQIQTTLQRHGYHVPMVCRSGEEILREVEIHEPDLVIIDVKLPGGFDGIETAGLIQSRHPIPVIFLSGGWEEETIAKANRLSQPYGYLFKPFNPQQLHSAVELALRRHGAEETHRRNEQHFHQALNSLTDAVITTDLAGQISFVNRLAEEITGWLAVEATGRPLEEVFHVVQEEAGTEKGVALPSGARSLVLTRRDGTKTSITDNTALIKDADGGLAGLVVIFRNRQPGDVGTTLSIQAPPGALQNLSHPLLAIDNAWHITYANQTVASCLPKSRDQLIGRNLLEELPGWFGEGARAEIYRALMMQEPRTFELAPAPNGRWLEVELHPFGEGLLLLLRDITDQKKSEETQSRMEKLESLGLLARGFAHDFNNVLTVLLGNLSLAENQLPPESEAIEPLKTAKRASLQAQNLVQQLLVFARGGQPIRQKVQLTDVFRVFRTEHQEIPGIRYQWNIPVNLPEALLDPSQLRRLLGNLVKNAEQALVSEGEIHVSCEIVPREEFSATGLSEFPGGPILRLVIEDNGPGIGDDNLARVFDPFFSTRRELNASGLGLTVCEAIARSHGGQITVESGDGRGTVVTVILPLPGPAGPPRASQKQKKGRVLILEDEPLIRSLMTMQLGEAGWDVVSTIEGSETITQYEAALLEKRPFDVVIVDLSIPNGMGGVKTVSGLRKLNPQVKAIVSSGYSDDPAMSRPAEYGFSAVLPKPYEPIHLVDLVAKVVDLDLHTNRMEQ